MIESGPLSVRRAIGTSWKYGPRLPRLSRGTTPAARNWLAAYWAATSNPRESTARPPSASEARKYTCPRRAAAVIVSAGATASVVARGRGQDREEDSEKDSQGTQTAAHATPP